MEDKRILIAHSDRLTQRSLYELLCRHEYVVDIANSFEEVLSFMQENGYPVILTDISEAYSTQLLKEIQQRPNPSRVIILTSLGNAESAVSSIKMGAFDYLVRPVEDEKIIFAIENAVSHYLESNEPQKDFSLKKHSKKEDVYNGLVGQSRSMKDIYSILERISNSKATVLLRGESGTGKRVIAHALHMADKRRRAKPIVEMSCGALPREIIESELFGHTKGAFTGAISDRKGRFEMANGGTILLDDIDSLALDLQVKLLRVLQHKEFERVGDNKTIKVDVRIIASTNQDIEKLVKEKKFREDLYYRLNVISINVPPLRERLEDLPLLVEYFINVYSKENHKKIQDITSETISVLTHHKWPGNIRELENIIERAVILDTDGIIDKDDLPEIILEGNLFISAGLENKVIKAFSSLKHAMQEPEKVHILRVLSEVGWNKKKAATKLGVNRTTLYNKMRKYNILTGSEK
ncbi:MAG: sigma-54-dependent Fis family transcriptional regulator [Candidatus Omnitrophica bacterium]|nr:sigma-54-dependent Fis family transcriptional regulator [Candidatus Omnitrophota bacterium]